MLPIRPLLRCLGTAGLLATLAACNTEEVTVAPVEDAGVRLVDGGLTAPDAGVALEPIAERVTIAEFRGTVDPAAGTMSIETLKGSDVQSESVRRIQQGLCALNIVQDGVPGSGPADSVELVTDSTALDGACASGAFGPVFCGSVTIRSFYTTAKNNVVAQITTLVPSTGYSVMNSDSIPGVPSGLGLWDYGNLNGAPGPGNSATREWDFARGGASFTFQGRVTVNITELCNGVDDDCDGAIDEGGGCTASGGACTANADCSAGLSCFSGACRAPAAQGGACATSADCAAGLDCESTVCLAPGSQGHSCTVTADCTSPLGCYGNICTTSGGAGFPCTANADCNSGLSCYTNACRALATDGGACAATTDCAAGLTCLASACRTVRTPSAAGEIVFSELMPSSQSGTGDLGEWMEIYNPSTTDYLDLAGCVLKDNTTGYAGHTFATANGTTLIGPGDYLVLAQSSVAAENHGLAQDYVYTEPAPATLTIVLSNSGDNLSITCGTTVIESFTYTSSTVPVVAGRSVQLDSGLLSATANDTGSNWCSTSGASTYGTAGKIGTPGAANGSCFTNYTVGRCRLQSPTTLTQVAGSTASIYARLSIPGLTDQTASNDTAAYVRGEIGYGADGSDPTAWTTWSNAGPSAGWAGTETGYDEYRGTLTLPSTAGGYDYAARFTGDNGTTWTYCDLASGAGSDGSEDGYQAANAGALTVNPLPTPPAPGEIVITEIMVNSQSGTDDGEWVEIYNTSTTTTFDLAGCQVGDNTTLHTIGATLEIAPQSYKVLGRSNNLTTTHGAVVDYVYGTVFGFNNSGGDNFVLKCSGIIIDSLQSAADAAATPVVQGYPSAWGGTTYSGASFQLDPSLYTAGDNDSDTSWCNSRTIFGTNNKKGTPGAPNNNCAVPVDFCRLQAPASITNYSAGTTLVTGRYRSAGVTNMNAAGNDISLWTKAQVGYGADGSDPSTWTAWTDASADTTYAGAEPLFDQYRATLTSPASGNYDYAFRFSGNNGSTWTYCDLDGAATNADYSAAQAGALTTSTAPSVPVAGELIFTEVMVASSGSATDDAEWIEVYNPSTTTSYELQGCILNNGTTNHTIASSLVVAPGAYTLLGRSTDTTVTLGAAVNYSYGTAFQLLNGGGNVKITCGTTVVDELQASAEGAGYPAEWGSADNFGRAFQLDPASRTATANDDDANWCNGQGAFGTGVYGTPGAANVNCAISIGWCRLQAPSTLSGFAGGTGFVYGRFYSAGFTDAAPTNGTASWLRAEAIVGASGSTPDNTWTSVAAASNTLYTTGAASFEANNDEWIANLVYPATIGNYAYGFRFSGDKGATWTTCDLNAGTGADGSEGGFQAANAGALSVVPIPSPPAAGEVIITEVMAGAGSSADDTEWIELTNTTGGSIDLAGCTISDGTSVHSIASALTVAANGYAVIGRSSDTSVNGGVAVNYAYGSAFQIGAGDNIVLACGGTTIDELAGFDAAWTSADYAGASFQLDTAAGVNSAAANDTDANWCNSRSAFGTAGKSGTPGAANIACATPVSYCKLQYPAAISAVTASTSEQVYGRVYAPGLTDITTGLNRSTWLRAELGYGTGTDASAWTTWSAASGNAGFTANAPSAGDDEYQAAFTLPAVGSYTYAFRFSGDNGTTWLYCDQDGAATNADFTTAGAGVLTSLPAAFSAGNLVVSRFGDGATTLGSAAAPVSLLELSPSAATVIATVDASNFSGTNILTDAGSSTAQGQFGLWNGIAAIGGYNAAIGTASVASSDTKRVNFIGVNRSIVGSPVNFPTSGLIPIAAGGFRSTFPVSSTSFYATGSTTGVWFYNGSTFSQVSSTATGQPLNVRVVRRYGNQLFLSSASGTFLGVSKLGLGTPTSGPQTAVLEINTAASSSPYGFVFFDTDANGLLDRAYIADDRSVTGAGLQRWDLVSGTWTKRWSLLVGAGTAGNSASFSATAATGFIGVRGLTGSFSGGAATLFATTTESNGNRVIRIADASADGSSTPGSALVLSVAASNYVYRGIEVFAVCGDGRVDGGEICDDGNSTDNDSCSNTCVPARCGDGAVQGSEACDDGNSVNTDSCTNVCAAAACGDGFVQGSEACDAGASNGTGTCSATCTCATGYHLEGGVCTSDTRSCAIANGTGSQTWDGSAYGTCAATSCGAGYHLTAGACDADVIACGTLPSNTTAGTQTWDGSTYGTCVATACATSYHVESGACTSDTRSCNITNGTGSQTWDGSAYSTCAPTACDTGYHVESGACASDTRSCTIANGTGSQTWSGSSYSTCAATSCDGGYTLASGLCIAAGCGNSSIEGGETCDDGNTSTEECNYGEPACTVCNATCQSVAGDTDVCGDGVLDTVEFCDDGNATDSGACNASCGGCTATFHAEGGVCTANVRSCDITNGTGTETWNGTAYGLCTLTSCNAGYHANGNTCEADSVGYCANLSATTTATLGDAAKTLYGELYIANATNAAGAYAPANVKFQYGSGAAGSNASTWTNWADATYDSENGNNDKYRVSVAVPTSAGAFDYSFRASTDGGTSWTYCMTGSAFSATYDTTKAGVFTTSGETIDWCNTQFPTSLNSTVSTSNTVYGQLYMDGKTNAQSSQYTGNGNPASQSGNVRFQFGYGADGSAPSGWTTWANATFNSGSAGNNNDEYQFDWTTPATIGRYDYQFRASGDGGATWTYCDTDGSTTGTGVNAPGDDLNTSGTTYAIGWCNIQSPTSVTSTVGSSASIYGQLYVAGQTEGAGQAPSSNVIFQFGYGAAAAAPSTWTTWSTTSFNVQVGNNDEYVKNWSIPADAVGSKYAFRASGNGGATWSYCGTGAGATNPNDGTDVAGWGATTISSAQACSNQTNGSQVVISQVYGAGGNSGATYNRDFIELHNRGNTSVDLTGWAVVYASSTGSFTSGLNATNLSGTIAAGGYLLIGGATGVNGAALPTVDISGSINLAGSNGKVALLSSTTGPASATCWSGSVVRDTVSFGTATVCETSAAPAPSTVNSIKRTESCSGPSFGDTNANGTDWSTSVVLGGVRNSASAASACSCTGP